MGTREKKKYISATEKKLNNTKALIIATLDGLDCHELGRILGYAAKVRLNATRKVDIGFLDIELFKEAREAMNRRLIA